MKKAFARVAATQIENPTRGLDTNHCSNVWEIGLAEGFDPAWWDDHDSIPKNKRTLAPKGLDAICDLPGNSKLPGSVFKDAKTKAWHCVNMQGEAKQITNPHEEVAVMYEQGEFWLKHCASKISVKFTQFDPGLTTEVLMRAGHVASPFTFLSGTVSTSQSPEQKSPQQLQQAPQQQQPQQRPPPPQPAQPEARPTFARKVSFQMPGEHCATPERSESRGKPKFMTFARKVSSQMRGAHCATPEHSESGGTPKVIKN